MRIKTIRIKWSDPVRIEDAIENMDDMVGLYYITRTFNKKEKSLYLGKSDSSVRERLIWHDKNWVHNYSHSKIWVRLGCIISPQELTSTIIDHAEKALIHEHGQYGTKVLFENTQYTDSYAYTDIYKIINEGNRFELKEVVDMNDHEDW